MSKIIIRMCRKSDDEGILNVCYRTGYMGKDLTGTNIFNDKKLFGYLFCLYYIWYETENCFAAVDSDNSDKVVGYIIGTLDSMKQEKLFIKKMIFKIARRMMFYTILKHPESFKTVLFFLKNIDLKGEPENLYNEYPAHLHINILPEYQHMGIGTMLLNRFEEYVRENGVSGIHLRTSSKNDKAIPFYNKKGYKIIYEKNQEIWRGVKDYKNLIFAKKIIN